MADLHEMSLLVSTAANSLVAAAGYLNQAPALYEMQGRLIMQDMNLRKVETKYLANKLQQEIDSSKANFEAAARTSMSPQQIASQLERVVEILQEMPDWTKGVL